MLTRAFAAPLAVALALVAYLQLAAAEPASALKERDRQYFKKCRAALAEPSLVPPTKNPRAEAYRLFYLPSFHDHVSMRVNIWSAESGLLTWHGRHRSHCQDGEVDERVFALSAEDVARVQAAIQRADFWNLPQEPGKPGEERIICSDGVGVFLEGVNDGNHRVIRRSCTWNSSFQGVVALFHELSRTKEPEQGALVLDAP